MRPKPNLSRIGCTGIVYDGFDLSKIFEIRNFQTSALPPIETNLLEVAQRPGSWFVSRKIVTRTFTLQLGLDARSRCPVDIFKAWRSVTEHIAKEDPRRLHLREESYYMAMLAGETDIENHGHKGIIEANLYCYDPFLYGKTHTIQLKAGDNKFRILGQCPVYPTIEITGVNGAVSLQDRASGKQVRLTGLTTTGKATIDMEHHACFLGGAYKAPDLTVTSYWPLSVGDQNLNLSAGTATLTYQERAL